MLCRALNTSICIASLTLAACGGEVPAASAAPAAGPLDQGETCAPAAHIEIALPASRVRLLSQAELLSEAVTNSFTLASGKLLVRDFDGFGTWLTDDFRGHDVFGAELTTDGDLPLDVTRGKLVAGAQRVVDKSTFLAALEARVAPWSRVERSHWKIERAEFQKARPVVWGRIEAEMHVVGRTAGGGREALRAHMALRVARAAVGWRIEQLALHDLEIVRRDAPLFVDVSRSAGVAHAGVRYGQDGNDGEGWNGAAAGDFDGDGRFDLFVPSAERNFLYRARAHGGFEEVGRDCGVAAPGGGTGALFLDFDNDGDQDLFVAHVGWENWDRSPGGEGLRAFANDGDGSFTDISAALGLADLRWAASSLTAFDADGDGWLDLFLCGYGRMAAQTNDNWIEATNGAPNALLRNLCGERFEDVTERAGLVDERWSDSAAAADVDGDGDIDLYVANNFGSNRLWLNRGDGTFEDRAEALGVHARGTSMGASFGDLDNDGRLDLYLTGPRSTTGKRMLERLGDDAGPVLGDLLAMAAGNALYLATDDGYAHMQDAGTSAGWAWGAALCDLDLDGALDVFCVNGFVTGDLPTDT